MLLLRLFLISTLSILCLRETSASITITFDGIVSSSSETEVYDNSDILSNRVLMDLDDVQLADDDDEWTVSISVPEATGGFRFEPSFPLSLPSEYTEVTGVACDVTAGETGTGSGSRVNMTFVRGGEVLEEELGRTMFWLDNPIAASTLPVSDCHWTFDYDGPATRQFYIDEAERDLAVRLSMEVDGISPKVIGALIADDWFVIKGQFNSDFGVYDCFYKIESMETFSGPLQAEFVDEETVRCQTPHPIVSARGWELDQAVELRVWPRRGGSRARVISEEGENLMFWLGPNPPEAFLDDDDDGDDSSSPSFPIVEAGLLLVIVAAVGVGFVVTRSQRGVNQSKNVEQARAGEAEMNENLARVEKEKAEMRAAAAGAQLTVGGGGTGGGRGRSPRGGRGRSPSGGSGRGKSPTGGRGRSANGGTGSGGRSPRSPGRGRSGSGGSRSPGRGRSGSGGSRSPGRGRSGSGGSRSPGRGRSGSASSGGKKRRPSDGSGRSGSKGRGRSKSPRGSPRNGRF